MTKTYKKTGKEILINVAINHHNVFSVSERKRIEKRVTGCQTYQRKFKSRDRQSKRRKNIKSNKNTKRNLENLYKYYREDFRQTNNIDSKDLDKDN